GLRVRRYGREHRGGDHHGDGHFEECISHQESPILKSIVYPAREGIASPSCTFGLNRQRPIARSASRSKMPRRGCASTTRALLTEPSGLIVNSTRTQPSRPCISASRGYCGGIAATGIGSPSCRLPRPTPPVSPVSAAGAFIAMPPRSGRIVCCCSIGGGGGRSS